MRKSGTHVDQRTRVDRVNPVDIAQALKFQFLTNLQKKVIITAIL